MRRGLRWHVDNAKHASNIDLSRVWRKRFFIQIQIANVRQVQPCRPSVWQTKSVRDAPRRRVRSAIGGDQKKRLQFTCLPQSPKVYRGLSGKRCGSPTENLVLTQNIQDWWSSVQKIKVDLHNRILTVTEGRNLPQAIEGDCSGKYRRKTVLLRQPQ